MNDKNKNQRQRCWKGIKLDKKNKVKQIRQVYNLQELKRLLGEGWELLSADAKALGKNHITYTVGWYREGKNFMFPESIR